MFRVFSTVFLCFSRVFTGIQRGKKSLVSWVVFLGFYLNTKEWKIRGGNRLRVGVRAKNASLSGFACRPF